MGLLNIQLKFNLRNRTHHVKSHINCYDLHNPAICIKSRDSIMVQDRYGQSVLKLIVFTGICDYTIHQFSISFRNCTAGCVHGSPTLFSDWNAVCPTRYRTRHFFTNSNTNDDIATKSEQEYVRCVRNEKECVPARYMKNPFILRRLVFGVVCPGGA